MNRPLISIIIPVYNAAPYLRHCLDSVCRQTYSHLEIICVNDGSTDGTEQLLQELAAEDSRIRVITQNNAGVSAARNNALDAAKGEWVTFVDSDDYLDPDYFQAFVHAIAEAPHADVLQGGITMVDEDGGITGSRRNTRGNLPSGVHAGNYEKLLFSIWGEGWAKLLRMSIINKHHLRFRGNLKVSEDQEFTCRYLMWCRAVYLVNHNGYFYVQHPNSCIHRFLAGKMTKQVYLQTTLYYFELIAEIPRCFSREQKRSCARAISRLCITSYMWRSKLLATRGNRVWAGVTLSLLLRLPYMMWKAGLCVGCSRAELKRFARQAMAALQAGL